VATTILAGAAITRREMRKGGTVQAVRAIMSCRTGPVERAEVERVFTAMGWRPNHPDDSPYLLGRQADLVARLPDEVRDEIVAGDPVPITPFPSVWGLASFDRRHALLLCLFSNDLELMKQQCVHAAVAFPRTFARVLEGRPCEFDPHVEIRRYDGNAVIARGLVSDTGHVRFRRFVWTVRRRERVILLALTAVGIVSILAALALYLWLPGNDWAYLRGYLDRLASAVQTAAIIMLVNLVFEYRDWKGAKVVIDWSVAEEST
jgi:hypothetical protein